MKRIRRKKKRKKRRRRKRRRRRRRIYNVNLTKCNLGENPGIFKGLFLAHPPIPEKEEEEKDEEEEKKREKRMGKKRRLRQEYDKGGRGKR